MKYFGTCAALAISLLLLTPPATAQVSVRSDLSDDREVTPGSTYEGVIQVANDTDEIQEAKIYQTDYRFYSDGSNIYGDPGQDERSNANWMRVSAPTITLPPHSTGTITYSVTVPEMLGGTPLEGSYWSMIMVEAVPKESPESTINPETGEPEYALLQIMRYGVQVATHISGTGKSEIALPESGLERLDGGVVALRVIIENGGSRMIRPEIWVELYGEDGSAVGRRDGVQSRIYPGTSINQQIRLGELEPGKYRALVILDGGGDEVYGAEYTLALD
ncbi:MAG: hypothetical protein HKN29_06500 [Rhodothermales bacterium]|nr:hypothetical protein [Rhodothermales bacterium]